MKLYDKIFDMKNFALDLKQIKSTLKRAAPLYAGADVLQKEVADRLLDRLDTLPIQSHQVLDIGVRTGYTTEKLAQKFPDAQITAVEATESMLSQSISSINKVCAYPEKLPFLSAQFDLIVVNLAFDWTIEKLPCLKEWRRVLKPNGLFLLSAFGPDTLYELRESFAEVDDQPHVHLFLDMHEVGDALLAANFAEPVIQSEHLQLSYASLDRLFKDLRETGATYAEKTRRRTWLGKNRWQRMVAQYKKFCTPQHKFPATIELTYAVCWAKEVMIKDQENSEITIPINSIKNISSSSLRNL